MIKTVLRFQVLHVQPRSGLDAFATNPHQSNSATDSEVGTLLSTKKSTVDAKYDVVSSHTS